MSIMPFSQEGEVTDGKVVGFVNHKRDINIIFAVRVSNVSKTNNFSFDFEHLPYCNIMPFVKQWDIFGKIRRNLF